MKRSIERKQFNENNNEKKERKRKRKKKENTKLRKKEGKHCEKAI